MRRTNRRRGLIAVSVIAALSFLSACGDDGSSSKLTENKDGMISITVATNPSDAGSQVFYAKNKDFFEEQGLDVTVDLVGNVAELAAAVESGDAQFATTSPASVASANAAGIDFKIVTGGAIYTADSPGVFLMVPTGSDIKSVEELEGKTIAVNALNTMPHLSTLATLDDAGVDLSSINFVTLDFTQVGQAFESGQVDAATVISPFHAQIEADGLGTVLQSPYDAVNEGQDWLNTSWFGQGDFLDANPEVAAKFKAAMTAASEWAMDPANAEERKSILQEYTDMTDATIKDLQLLQFGPDPTAELLQPVLDIMDRFDVLPKPIKTSDITAEVD